MTEENKTKKKKRKKQQEQPVTIQIEQETAEEERQRARQTIQKFIEGAETALRHGLEEEYVIEFGEKYPILFDAIVTLLPDNDRQLVMQLVELLRKIRENLDTEQLAQLQ